MTRISDIVLLEDGCVVTRIKAGVEQSIEDATENLDWTIRACGGRRRPLLVDISRAKPISAEVRRLYTGDRLLESFLAVALLVEASPLGRMMGNIYLRLARLGIPARLFADENEALAWLRTHL